jgi:L-threonylcarbamoyladenylate synthase
VAVAARLLAAGGVVALPTETVYGLAADIRREHAVRRIYQIKGRPLDHPLIVHIAAARDIDRYALDPPDAAHVLAARFWPGPLTIVLRASAAVPAIVTAGQDTVALRMVDHPDTLAILRSLGGAVAAPSANRFGKLSPTTAEHVRADLGDDVDLIVDGGPCRVGIESTIVDLTGGVPAVLRVGAISGSQLADALGCPVVERHGGNVRVPGTLASHYAPHARLELVAGDAIEATVAAHNAAGERAVALTLPSDPIVAARRLYATLRALDAEGVTTIVATLPPDDEAHAGVRDRLTRAAAPRERD